MECLHVAESRGIDLVEVREVRKEPRLGRPPDREGRVAQVKVEEAVKEPRPWLLFGAGLERGGYGRPYEGARIGKEIPEHADGEGILVAKEDDRREVPRAPLRIARHPAEGVRPAAKEPAGATGVEVPALAGKGEAPEEEEGAIGPSGRRGRVEAGQEVPGSGRALEGGEETGEEALVGIEVQEAVHVLPAAVGLEAVQPGFPEIEDLHDRDALLLREPLEPAHMQPRREGRSSSRLPEEPGSWAWCMKRMSRDLATASAMHRPAMAATTAAAMTQA